jgi:hypothetical protein
MTEELSKINSKGQSGGITAQNVTIVVAEPPIPLDSLGEIREVFIGESKKKPYSVLICLPTNQNDDIKAISDELSDKLNKEKVQITYGGVLTHKSRFYPHIEEAAQIVKEKFNTIILIADDAKTFSQLSLFSYLCFKNNSSKINIVLVPVAEIKDEYLKQGPVQYVEDEGNYFNIEIIKSDGVDQIIELISRRRMAYNSQK